VAGQHQLVLGCWPANVFATVYVSCVEGTTWHSLRPVAGHGICACSWESRRAVAMHGPWAASPDNKYESTVSGGSSAALFAKVWLRCQGCSCMIVFWRPNQASLLVLPHPLLSLCIWKPVAAAVCYTLLLNHRFT